jgi:hypothetical protein
MEIQRLPEPSRARSLKPPLLIPAEDKMLVTLPDDGLRMKRLDVEVSEEVELLMAKTWFWPSTASATAEPEKPLRKGEPLRGCQRCS